MPASAPNWAEAGLFRPMLRCAKLRPIDFPELVMPIYEYRCSRLRPSKRPPSENERPPLTTCPACGAESYAKQISAAGFQLKGSGWYATDFKGSSGASPRRAGQDGKRRHPQPHPAAAVARATEDDARVNC
jgi:putative FmdB family regulatory protein